MRMSTTLCRRSLNRLAWSTAIVGAGVFAYVVPAHASANYSSVILAGSPVAYWQLAESPGSTVAADSSGHGNNGTYSSCVQLGVRGPIHGGQATAGVFGTEPTCWMEDAPAGAYSGDFSVEAWVKPFSASKFEETFFSTRTSTADFGFDFKLVGSDTPSGQAIQADVGDGSEWLTTDRLPFTFVASHWYYLVATVSAAHHVLVIYVDGTVFGAIGLQQQSSLAPLLFDANHPVTVGANPFDNNPPPNGEGFDGVVGQVAVYEYVMTPAQVKSHNKSAVGG